MNTDARNAFINASLAHAAYVRNLTPELTTEGRREVLETELSGPLAAYIADRYRVVGQTNHASSGFSVTVFSELATGQRYISFRGTDELLPDFVGADADILFGDGTAYFQLVAMVNWYMRASTPQGAQATQLADTWRFVNGERVLDTYVIAATGELAGSPDWIVNGHSLGGHLTTAFARLFGNSATRSFTYNGAGFLDSANEVFAIIERSLGIAPTEYPGPLRQKNYFAAHGVTFATNDSLLRQFGERIGVFNELGAPLSNHSIYKLTDSLALSDVLADIDNALSLDQIRGILDAGSASAPASLESVLDAVRRLYQVADQTPTQVGDAEDNAPSRADFHAKLADARSAVSAVGGTSLVSLAGQTADDLVAQATGAEGLPFRYALKELNPFAVIDPSGALYARFQPGGAQQGELDLFAPAADRAGSLTPDWIGDRAALLQAQILRSIADHATLAFVPGSGDIATEFHHYRNGTEEVLFAEPTIRLQSPLRTQVVSFADDSGRVLAGSDNALPDRLYGGAGTDALQGKAGDDRLEGGRGLDLYQYRGARQTPLFGSPTLRNDGNDTVLDTDGKGVLRYSFTNDTANPISTVISDASVKVNSVTWQSADAKFSYIRSGADLLIVINGDAFGTLRLKEFRDGDFGIRLNEGVAVPLDPVRTFYGDKQDWDANPVEDGIQPAPDGFGNFIRADGLDDRPDIDEPGRADRFFGSAQDVVERFAAASGNDTLFADGPSGETGGADLVEAGEGRDIVWSGPGHDFIEGGFDGTSIEVVDGQSVAVSGGDVLNAGPGNDALYGLIHSELAVAIRNGETDLSQNRKGDFLSAHDGDDRGIGAAENDVLLGGDGRDVLVGGAGDDDFGGDLPYGAATPDWRTIRTVVLQESTVLYQLEFLNMLGAPIPAGAADAIYGGAGADWALGGGGDDFIDSGSGDDFSAGEAGADLLIGGAGNDVLVGDNGPGGTNDAGDYLDGGAGNDSLQGDGGDDILVGGPGEDTLTGGAGKDIYLFDLGDGSETVFDTGGDDPANPAERSIVILGEGLSRNGVKFRTGSLMVDFGAGDALHFSGFNQIDPASTPLIGEIRFADGSSISYLDILMQGFDIDGTEEDDDGHDADHPQLTGTGVVDRIRGFGGNDVIFGFGGDDSLDAGAGADQIVGGAGSDTITAGGGDDFVWADEDSLAEAEHGDDSVSGGAGNDGMRGYGGNDFLAGDEGADLLWGEMGADTLDGGSGADTLTGHAGDDTYVFARGYGADLIVDQDSTSGNVDTIEFAAGISADEVIGRRGTTFPNDLILTLWNTADSLTIADHFRSTSDRVEQIRFADGTATTPDAIPTLMRGTAGSDFLSGTSGRDALEGLAGNDQLEGGAEDDRYYFRRGDGQDTILDADPTLGNLDKIVFAADLAPADLTARRSGSNLVLSVAGTADQVTVSNYFENDGITVHSIEQIQFLADGSAWDLDTIRQSVLSPTAGNDTIIGYAGDDLLSGLAGNDSLAGNAGNDTLEGGAGNDTLQGGTGNDTYRFAPGAGEDFLSEADSTPGNIDRIVYSADIQPAGVTPSTSGSNLVLSLAGGADRITISNYFLDDGVGASLVEVIEFLSDGTAWDFSTVKQDILTGTDGPDTIVGFNTDDLLTGLGGDDVLNGNAGADTMDGGPGNDSMAGGTGNDTYLIARAVGQERIVDLDSTAGNIDRVVYAPDIVPAEVAVSRSANDLLLSLGGTPDQVRIINYLETDGVTPYLVEEIRFEADGTVWDVGRVKSLLLAPTSGDDTIIGYAAGELLEGLAGNDNLRGEGGNDTLDGGTGNDVLQGGAGSDTYLFSRGYGQDLIVNAASDPAGTTDTLRFASDIAPADVTPSRGGNDLVLTVSGGAGEVRIQSYFASGTNVVEEIRFADGTVWSEQTILTFLPPPTVFTGTEGPDVIRGDNGNNLINGLGGDDRLYGFGGNDTLTGGRGADWLYGASGNDTYVFNTGDGVFSQGDVVGFDDSGIDTLRFGPGFSPADTSVSDFESAEYGRYLFVGHSGDGMYILGYFGTGHVEEIRFDNGVVWNDQAVAPFVPITGTNATESLAGTSIADVINSFGGNDTLHGLAGHDTLDGGLGADTLFGGNGDDVLVAGTGETKNASIVNTLYGDAGNDVLLSSGKNDQLLGGEGNDVILGAAGADYIIDRGNGAGTNLMYGAGGADTFEAFGGGRLGLVIGGIGNDSIYGGGPSSPGSQLVVAFNKSDGADYVGALASGSTVSIGGGTLYSNLSLEVQGLNLRLKTGSSHHLTFADWYSSTSWAGKNVSTLQIVTEGTRDYNAASSDPMKNRKIQSFDFRGLVAAWDAAGKPANWSVANHLAAFRIGGSDTAAIGGAIAYQYARTGNLGTLTHSQMQAVINDPAFGVAAQSIAPVAAPASAAAAVPPDAAQDSSFDVSVQSETFSIEAAALPVEERAVSNEPMHAAPEVQSAGSRTPLPLPDAPLPRVRSIRDSMSASTLAGTHAAERNELRRDQRVAPPFGGSRVTDDAADIAGFDRVLEPVMRSTSTEGRENASAARGASDVELKARVASRLEGRDMNGVSIAESTLSDSTANAAAWLRVARDLQADVASYAEFGRGAGSFSGFGLSADLAAVLPVVPAVGIAGASHIGLRTFEGLKEGFATLA